MSQPRLVDATLVKYYAVYPDGRRCSVTQQDALSFEKKWLNEDDVRVYTRLECVPMLVVGTLEEG